MESHQLVEIKARPIQANGKRMDVNILLLDEIVIFRLDDDDVEAAWDKSDEIQTNLQKALQVEVELIEVTDDNLRRQAEKDHAALGPRGSVSIESQMSETQTIIAAAREQAVAKLGKIIR